MTKAGLEEDLAALETMDMSGLRELWRRRFGVPPRLRSRDLLRRILAFELQADVHGGLSADLKKQLRGASCARARKPVLQPGTTLTREWRGERHVVEVTARGFEHDGVTFRSLSEIARGITGARWSGPRFFGVAEHDRKVAA